MFDKIINLYEKYKGIILYGIFGILTTVINFVLYFLFVNLFSVNYLISNCIAWIGAVIFAFYTNKIYVFESKNNELGNVFKEFILFTGSRAFTFFIETLLLFLGVELLKLNNGIVKIAIAVIVVILNYVFTKFVFKNNIQDIKIVGKKTEKRIWYKNYYLIYTIIFIIACFIIYLPFIFEGKSFFYNYDGVSQHYNSLVYFGKYIRSIIKNLLLNHQLIIPMWDLSVGFGQDILTSLNYYSIGDVLDILFVLTPIKFSSYMYVFLILFRMFLSGICFSLYCFKMKQSKYSTLVGTLCYVFCGYVIFSSIRHPFFINPMLYLPLILIGIENILKGKKPYLFMVMIGISAISNFYFLYMLTIAVVFYAIVRVLYLYKDKGLFIKMFFKYLFVLGGYYLLSILLVSVLFIPVIYGFLYCSRISKDTGVNLLLYHCNYYLSFISQLFQVKEVGNYQSFNITIVTFLSCIMLVNLQDKISKYLKYILFILIISSFLPIIGLVMNGGSYISNRWSFVFSFVVSFITVFIFNNFKIYLLKYKKSIMKTSCIYGFLILVSSIILIFITKKNDAENLLPYYYYYISFVFLNISILLIYIASQKCKNKIIYNNIILIIVFLNLCIPAYLYLSTSGGNYVDSFLSREYAYSTLKDKNIKYVKKNDQSIYRIGISNVGTSSKYTYNYGMANNIPGTSSYYSLINKNLTELYNETGNIGLKNLSNLTGFNNREVFNSLFGIKYYILAEKENKSTIPYGYTKLKENELIYKNNNDLPLFYTYNSFISRKDYEQLELNKKESSMLQGVVLDNEIKYRKTKLKFNDETVLNNEDIYNILNKNNSIMISKNKIIAKEDNTELKIPFKGDENNEYYLIFKSLSYKNNNNSLFPSYYTGSNVKINFSKSKRDDNIVSLKTSNHPNYFGKLNLLYNLGRYDKKSDCILIKLSKKGEYSFSDMKLVRQSMNDFSNHIDKLKEDKLNKLTIDGNYVEANITTKEDKIGVLAIPYSPGWKAYVNGQETEVLRANTAFMGVKLEKGNNSIVFKYTTPGLREGAIISLITILLTLLYVKFKKYKIKIS